MTARRAKSLLVGTIPSNPSSPAKMTKKAAETNGSAAAGGAASDGMTEQQAGGSWDAEELQHHDKPGGEAKGEGSAEEGGDGGDGKHHKFHLPKLHKQHSKKTSPLDWGFPGELTKEEVDVYMKFRDEVEKRGGDFKKTVYNFGEVEGEAWALTRWLRARKFKYDDVVLMVEQATECRDEPGRHDFYPDPAEALGVDPFVYIQQYPQLYSGNAKSGCPLFISKPGILNVDGMECITTLDGIYRYHWHVMMHDYANRLRENKKKNPDFTRFQCVCVLDLDGLSTSQITSRALNIIKKQTEIDSLCFPETMERMVVVNAPRFFALTWRLIKGWIDPRTAGKVEIMSGRKQWEGRLRELVDEDQLPSDYGGKSEDTDTTLMKTAPEGMTRQLTDLWHLRAHHAHVFEVRADEDVEITVYTRGVTGAVFSVTDKDHKKADPYVTGAAVKHGGKPDDENEPPTSVKITEGRISGPAHIRVKADSNSGRFSGTETYLVVANFYKK